MTINTANCTLADIKAAETSELLAVYNAITGKGIKKFATRANAESQTWKQIQSLAPGEDITKNAKAIVATSAKKGKSTNKGKGRVMKEHFSKRAEFNNQTIEVLVEENPKKKGSKAFAKFAVVMKMNGKSVEELKAQEGKHKDLDDETGWPSTELRWAINKKLVKLHKVKDQVAA